MEAQVLEHARQRVEEGKARAAARFAAFSPETQAAVEASVATAMERLPRLFCSPGTAKGRQSGYVATPAEMAEWLARQ